VHLALYEHLSEKQRGLLVLLQAAFEALVQSHFSTTLDSQQLQPLRDSVHLVLLCSTFDATAYSSQQITARSLASDVAATAGWLSQLADGCSHSISIAAASSSTATVFVGITCSSGGAADGDSKQCMSQYGASSSSGGSGSSNNGVLARTAGLVVMEVGAVRSAMLKMAGAALG
jgi:hypothetical protein